MAEEIKQIDFSDKVYKLVIAVVILIAIFYIGNLVYNFQSLPQNYPQEISISGSAKVYAKPDVASVSIGVIHEAPEVSVVIYKSTDKMNAIIKAIKDLGVDEKDIQTTQYSITPQYNWTEKEGRVLEGYSAQQSIQVKIRNFDKIGDILDKASANGANNVGNLQFTIDDLEKVRAEARQKAIEEAKTKAETLAKQAGLKIVKLINISEGYGDYLQPFGAKGAGFAMESANVAPEIEAGQMEINSTVTLTYRVR